MARTKSRQQPISCDVATTYPHHTGPQSNGVAERVVRRVLEGTPAVIMKSGLPRDWWSEAAHCYCLLRNANDKIEPEKTPPYEARHDNLLRGRLLPFGASYSYKPATKRDIAVAKKFDGKVRKGILKGYPLQSGGLLGDWPGDVIHGAEALRRLCTPGARSAQRYTLVLSGALQCSAVGTAKHRPRLIPSATA